jgi:putative secreted protein
VSRLFWILVGAALAVVIALRGKQWLHRFTPQGMAEKVEETGQRAAAGLGEFYATFRAAMHEREAELREELSLPNNS